MFRKLNLRWIKSEFLVIPFVILLFQLNFVFSDYIKVSEDFHKFDAYISGSPQISAPKSINLKYYDNKYSKNFEIEFSFRARTTTGNLFQTDNEGSGIRLELVPSAAPDEFTFLLQYRAWDGERFLKTTKSLELNRDYILNLSLNYDNQLRLSIDNREILKERISKQDIRFKRFILGAGLSGTRVFNGDIANATFNLDTFERESFVPTTTVIIVIIFLLFISFVKNLSKSRRFPDGTSILRELLAVSIVLGLILRLNFQRSFENFFGDDFLMLWPIRGSDPLTIFTESIGPQYRPLTELLLLLRFEVHGLNLSSWSMGGKLFSTLLLIYLYWFLREKIRLGITLTSLACLGYMTSIQFLGSSLWWASVGTQHLLSQSLTIYLFSSVIDFFRDNLRKSKLSTVIFRGLLLTLTSEIFIPIFIVTPALLIFFGDMIDRRHLLNSKMKFSHKIMRRGIVRSLLFRSFPFLVAAIVFFSFRLIVVQVGRVVAASSAKNFDFSSFDFLSVATQFFEYFFTFSGNIFGVHFYDYGANEYRLMSFSDYGQVLKVLTLSLAILGMYISLKNIALWWNWHLTQWGKEQYLNFSLLLVMILSILIPSLVPDYQQIRWVQLPFFLYLVLMVRVRFSQVTLKRHDFFLGIFLVVQVVSNLFLIHDNFGVNIL